MPIRSFACSATKAFAETGRIAKGVGWAKQKSVVARKLAQLNVVARLDELRIPPGNRLEALAGDRSGQFSIRVNDQWRICFRWTDKGPAGVEVTDYH